MFFKTHLYLEECGIFLEFIGIKHTLLDKFCQKVSTKIVWPVRNLQV